MRKQNSLSGGSLGTMLETDVRGLQSVRVDRAALLLLAALAFYCVVGLTGFDPSKQDEAYILGIVLEYVRGGNWIVPTLAGEPFMEKPPLFYLMAAGSAQLLSRWLPLHDGARMASGVCTALTGLILGQTARLLLGGGYGRYAVIALFGTFGFVVPSHMLLTDNANLTGMALAMLGFAYVGRNEKLAGAALGTGAGMAFLSKGLFGAGVIALSVMLLPILFREWRSRRVARALLFAGLFSLPWFLTWPLLLFFHSPDLFMDWFWLNNVGRFFGFAAQRIYIVYQGDFWYRVLPWATFPALPLVLVTLLNARRLPATRAQTLWRHPAFMISLAMILALTALMSTAASIRGIYAMPLLLPLALLAAPALRYPPHWLERVLMIGGMLLFVTLALGSLVLWMVMALGLKPPLREFFERLLVPGLAMPVQALDGFVAVGFCLLWVICFQLWRNSPWRGAGIWYISVLAIMGVMSQLWIPWVSESRSSYRYLYEQMARFLPADNCVASEGLGESQRGMLDYVLGIKTRRLEHVPNASCAALLVDGETDTPLERPGWFLLWSGMRAPDDHEKFLLFVVPPELGTRVH